MVRKLIISLLIIIVAISTFVACDNSEQYPDEPIISFKEFYFIDTTIIGNRVLQGTLVFDFTDGDGDIGFDTTSPRQNTIFLKKYKVVNNVITEMELATETNYFVDKIFKDNSKHSIAGEMHVEDLNEYIMSFGDTIMYKFYIVDRAGNRSNTDSTGLIVVR